MSAVDPDRLTIHGLREDPMLVESVIRDLQARYYTDPQAQSLLFQTFLDPDRPASFERFRSSLEFRTIQKLLSCLGVEPLGETVEVGGGPGFLAWALRQSGWPLMTLVEPNGNQITGTGYLDSLPDQGGVNIYNDLDKFYRDPKRYDVVFTKNCIHHFMNISQVAASIRQKMTESAVWIALREWFADTPQELYGQIANHPFCQSHDVYEWPYPASHYVEAIEIAGFTLEAVIPAGYENNCLAGFNEQPAEGQSASFSRQLEGVLNQDRRVTVRHFWQEVVDNKFNGSNKRQFSRPQMMLFRRSYL